MIRRWYVPLVGALLLFLVFHQLYSSRKPLSVDQELVVEMVDLQGVDPTEQTYDVRDGVPLVESERQVDPEDDPKNTIIIKEAQGTGDEFADETEVEEIIEAEKGKEEQDIEEAVEEMDEEEVLEEEEVKEAMEEEELGQEEEEEDYAEEGEFADESAPEEDVDIFKIHVNSYQRSGSSFVGKLFDIYQPAFFVYEPLEMLYTSLYGVTEDNVVPHNIFFTHQQKHRTLEKKEMEMTRWAMDQVFNCNMKSYPTSMLTNIFWSKFTKFMSVGIPYVECLEKAGVNMTLSYSTLSQCQRHIRVPCANTFSTQWQPALDNCHSVMHANGEWQGSANPEVWKQFEGTEFGKYRESFQSYFNCLSPFETAARECAAVHLDRECKKKDVRVVKTVRAPMDLSEVLLKDYENFNVVHLFRDPRGVILSRMKADWSYAIFENDDPSILARTYCRVIMNEIAKKEKLEGQYPGRIVSLVHDTLLNNVVAGAKNIFTSLDLDYTEEVGHYVEVYTKMSKLDRWKTTLTVKNIRSIEEECQDLMDKAGFEIYVQNAADDKLRSKQYKEFNQKKQAISNKKE